MQAAGSNGFVKRQLAIEVPIASSDDASGDTCDDVESTKQLGNSDRRNNDDG